MSKTLEYSWYGRVDKGLRDSIVWNRFSLVFRFECVKLFGIHLDL